MFFPNSVVEQVRRQQEPTHIVGVGVLLGGFCWAFGWLVGGFVGLLGGICGVLVVFGYTYMSGYTDIKTRL